MPSWLTLKEKEFFVGGAAKNTQHQKSTKLTVFDIRRALSSNLVSTIGLPYQLTKELAFEQNNVSISLVRVIAILFAAIKEKIEKSLNEQIKKVVLTIPTNFNIKLQQILVDACQIANLKVIKLLFEPVATAITYYSLKKSEKKAICVIDFGGGKLDVANFVIEEGKILLLNYSTDLQLGGRDYDERVLSYVLDNIKQKYPSIILNDRIITMIREKCILAKESLTTCTQKSIETEIGDDEIKISLTRSDFEKICEDLFKRVLCVISLAITKIDKTRLTDVILVGGSTRMPKFQSDVQQLFPNIPLNVTINADEAIAKGACMYGALKSGLIKKFKIEDKVPWNGTSLQKPKTKTFVDENGIVQNKIVEESFQHFTDITHEQNEIKKMFEKNEEVAKREDVKIEKVDAKTLALAEKYLDPEYSKKYEQHGYNIVALKTLNQYFQSYSEENAKAHIMNHFIPRIDICLKAIHLYHEWVPQVFHFLTFF
uniref:Heat shock protein 70 n=1 Tax=Panagrolaimus davidi TaxID=227884 RepID=A0A914PRV6_9BILA